MKAIFKSLKLKKVDERRR